VKPRIWAALCVFLLAGCFSTDGPPMPLANVDLPKIYGGWYILATIPNHLERGVTDAYDHFAPGRDGEILEDFYCRWNGFDKEKKHYSVHIEILPATNNADWRVKPIWPVRLPFQVVYADPDGKFLLFGEQDRSLGWIYAREKIISDADYERMMRIFRGVGYDTSQFRRVVQLPEQIGKPGFWSDDIQAAKSP
jgi:apolipoprotein D and lipocalin family protein